LAVFLPRPDRAHEENERCGGAWNGEITEPLREFLTAMQSFFDGQAQLVDSRREHARRFMGSLDGTPGLPEDVQLENAKQWMNFHRYFDAIAHHKSVEEPEFRVSIAGFEVFISTRLKPRPTDDFATIDALLEED
jgi:hypothetical protein